jgi:hypothetical protein
MRVLLELELQEFRQKACRSPARSCKKHGVSPVFCDVFACCSVKRVGQNQHFLGQVAEVTLSVAPDRLKRYAGMARLLYKYGSRDLVARAGLDHAMSSEPLPDRAGAASAADLAADLEHLGPAYIKLGQLLSTRGDLLGLLLASLIVGAALLMRVTTSFTILGYPGLAMIFFLLAAAGGIWLAVSILTGDRPRHKRASS